MKSRILTLAFACLAATFPAAAIAGESSLTLTWQPLSVLGAGEIRIHEVACHDWNAHSGFHTAIGLISARNVPPTNNPEEATNDINLASACHLVFGHADLQTGAKQELLLDATRFRILEAIGSEKDREKIVRSALECLRRVTTEAPYDKLPLALKATEADTAWMEPIVKEFNAHDRGTVFYSPAK